MNEETPITADSLLEELKNLNKTLKNELQKEQEENNTAIPTVSATPIPTFKLDENNLSDFIMENSQKLIKTGLETIDSLKDIIANTADSKSMLGFAEIVKATSGAIDTLNSINIEKRKAQTAKEVKQLDIDGRKQIAASKKPNNTVNLIAPREQIIKMLEEVEEKRTESPVIDTEFKEIPPNN